MLNTSKDAVLAQDDELAKKGMYGSVAPDEFVIDFGRFGGDTIGQIGATREGWSYLKYLGDDMDDTRLEAKTNIREWLAATPRPVLPLEECLNYSLCWGKYKNRTFRELSKTLEGHSYMKYLKAWEAFNDSDVVNKVIDEHWPKIPKPTLDMSRAHEWTMPFGKFKGIPISQMKSKKQLKHCTSLIDQLSKKKGKFRDECLIQRLMHHVDSAM